LKKSDPTYQASSWTTEDSSSLYGLDRWGEDYFSINNSGNINVHPKGKKGESLDLIHLLEELKWRDLKPPLLIRFDDVL